MTLTPAHISPIIALAAGILILIMPKALNYIVAIYLIVVGVIGLNGIYHFVRLAPSGEGEDPYLQIFHADLVRGSALPPKPDLCGALANVRFGPKADIPSFNVRVTRARRIVCLPQRSRAMPCQQGRSRR